MLMVSILFMGPCLLESIDGSMRLSRERIGAPGNMDVDGARRATGPDLRAGLRRSSAAGTLRIERVR